MASQEHLEILHQGVQAWNQWRETHPEIKPDLSGISLYEVHLKWINFSRTDLSNSEIVETDLSSVNLRGASLKNSRLSGTILESTDLQRANLCEANLSGSHLRKANLRKADIAGTDLYQVNLRGVSLHQAQIGWTRFVSVDLSVVKGLETVVHEGPSSIGIDTIIDSHGKIPEVFLRKAGVPQSIIEQIPSLVGSLAPIQYYSCFISYSSKDEAFAKRLYADLQSHNVPCWYALEDLKIGDKFRHRIDESIRVYDKLLLVLSEASIASTWVGYEVEKALDKEPEGMPNVLFPISLDKAIMTCETDWAKDIRKSRHIGDFEHWKDHDTYQIAFARLLRDLKAQS